MLCLIVLTKYIIHYKTMKAVIKKSWSRVKAGSKTCFAAMFFFHIRNANTTSNKSKQQLREVVDREILNFSVIFLFYITYHDHLKFVSYKGKTFLCLITPTPFNYCQVCLIPSFLQLMSPLHFFNICTGT